MKKYYSIVVVFFAMVLNLSKTDAQIIQLPRACKFMYGDDLRWANPQFNDLEWEQRKLGEGQFFDDKKTIMPGIE